MNRKTVFLLVGLLIIALASLGVGYGLWFEDLKLHGDIVTGELDVDWSGPGVIRYFDVEGVGTVFESNPGIYKKKFESVYCNAYKTGKASFNPEDDGDPDILMIEAYGVYPSFHCDVYFDVHNEGNVPVHFSWKVLTVGPEGAQTVAPVEAAYCWSLKDVESPEYTMDETGMMKLQLHQNEQIWCKIAIHFTNDTCKYYKGDVCVPIAEGDKWMWQAHIRAYQWNESPQWDKYPFWFMFPKDEEG